VTEPRPYCYTCNKATATCVCSTVTRLNNRTGITIVQHPRENGHALGTARFAELGLSNSRVLIDFAGRYRKDTPPFVVPPRTGLLYPSASALNLATLPEDRAPSHLVVIDGTWHQAHTLYRDMKWLHGLPHYVLSPDAPSRYRIRSEPQEDYISTLEAVLMALKLLEPSLEGVETLLQAFDRMIDQQIACEEAATAKRFRSERRSAQHQNKPRALAEHFENLVILYSETLPTVRSRRELVYVCAHRLRDNSVFEQFVQPTSAPASDEPYAHLCAHRREGHRTRSVDAGKLAALWEQFADAEDVFVAWNPHTLRVLPQEHQKPPGRAVALKAVYGGLRQGQGSLEQIIALENLSVVPAPLPGRAGQRLGNARALAEFLRNQ
jgi:DTW domain-containing protein